MSNYTKLSKRKSFSRKLAWEIVLAVWIVMGILSIIIYKVVNSSLTKMEEILYQEILLHTKETVADKMKTIDADDLTQVADILKDADERVNNNYKNPFFESDDVYSFIADGNGKYIVVSDSANIQGDSFPQFHTLHTPDSVTHFGISIASLTIDDADKAVFYTSICNTPYTLFVVIPQELYYGTGRLVGIMLLVMIAVSLMVIFLGCVVTIRHLTGPLTKFAVSTQEIAKGNFDVPLPDIKSHDEIGLLHDSFQDMQHSLSNYIEELKTTTASKAAMEKELNIARNIQMSMIPKKFPPYPKRKDIDIYGFMKPAKAVGGDLFDFFIRDEKLFFCIGDVSGKGVPAALYMTVTKNLFRSFASREIKPDEILKGINEAMMDGNNSNMFVTLFVGVLHLNTGHLDYCNGGHEVPLVVNSNGVTELPVKTNAIVGLMPVIYEAQAVEMTPGTTLMLFTDGLSEGMDSEAKEVQMFGRKRIMETAHQAVSSGHLQPRPLIEQMIESLHAFTGDAEQSDDLTMLAVSYYGKEITN